MEEEEGQQVFFMLPLKNAMKNAKRLSMLLALVFLLVAAEANNDPPGFLTIDCGLVSNKSYIGPVTGLTVITDVGLINTGESRNVPDKKDISRPYWTVRIFPQGNRNCYTLKPLGGRGSRYLIRATFHHGGYDGSKDEDSYKFDLHIGPELWESIEGKTDDFMWREIIHTLSSDSLSICLVKTGKSIPFISFLELRPFNNTQYPKSTSLKYVKRLNFNPPFTTPDIIRYPDDIYDRFWIYSMDYDTYRLSTNSAIDNTKNLYQVPSVVMSTARLAVDGNILNYNWTAESEFHLYYLYLHFAELELLGSNELREFNLYVNDNLWGNNGRPFSPSYLTTETLTKTEYLHGYRSYNIQLYETYNSTEPPIINAAEIYVVQNFTVAETQYQDVEAVSNIKTTYRIIKNWQGDPCAPTAFIWDGIKCRYGDVQQIISLNLSNSVLEGPIDPAIFNLSALQTLDLSYNRLTGKVPDFLAQIDSLKVLNLTGNFFSGTIPRNLIEKSKAGELSLSFDEANRPGEGTNNKINLLILIAAAATFFLVLGVLIAICNRKRKKKESGVSNVTATEINIEHEIVNKEVSNEDLAGKEKQSVETKRVESNKDLLVKTKNLKFAYDEIVAITNNFETVLGEGGFGKVYHGYMGETEVAVKMLSKSSLQGPKEFQAEANLLMGIHHKNLTPFVGYYYEMSNMGIIYEYMANGTLERHLFGNSSRGGLTWVERLQIAIDAAQGLEYLHHGCKPSIVHRDIKTTNILLDDKFKAKLADFGLSRAFPVGGATHVTTVVAGTLGYLDPESFSSGRVTEKSDVYSFGVVLLELITGRQATPKNNVDQMHIVSWVSSELDTGDIAKIVDKRLNNEVFSVNSGWRYLELAIACVARNSNRRPTMIYVAAELQECMALQNQMSHHHELDDSSVATSQSSIRTASMSKLYTELLPKPR